MLNENEKLEVKSAILSKVNELKERIAEYKELTKPIPPENAIGRVSRMDAINNKSVNEAALREAEKRLLRLQSALERIDGDHFGLCVKCGNGIPIGRILIMPGSRVCVRCG